MSTQKLSNISLQLFRKFLQDKGCKNTRTTGGHEHWTRKDLNRPITLQTHVNPIPEFIVKNHLRSLGLSKEDFFNTINKL